MNLRVDGELKYDYRNLSCRAEREREIYCMFDIELLVRGTSVKFKLENQGAKTKNGPMKF